MRLKKIKMYSIMIAMTLGLGLTACNTQKPMDKETIICFETSKGEVKVKLYNETPKHRDNMIKLVKEGFYDGTLFHRVINRFMIQGGDPESKTAKPDQMLGEGDTGYTIPAEFAYPKYFHKKGALAAAREPDEVNPEMASSGCQFYIVTGKKFTREALKDMEDYLNDQRIREVYDSIARPYMKEMYLLRKSNQTDSLASLQDKLMTEAEAKAEHFAFTAEQKEAYSTVGGAPHLDGTYTVFGEVIEGMEVVEAIQKVKTNRADRPLEDVVIKKATVVKD